MDEPIVLQQPIIETRTGLDVESIKRDFLDNLIYAQGRFPSVYSTPHDRYAALAYTVRDRLLHRWHSTLHQYFHRQADTRLRPVCYFSAEFLLGPQLGNNLINLGIEQPVRQAMSELGLSLDELLDIEEEPGLGNGGLGRLAACYLDSLASLEVPAIGYGIHYEFGLFNQTIRDGWQVEATDKWLQLGSCWEIPRSERVFQVKLGGHTEAYRDEQGRYRVRWIPSRVVNGIPVEIPVVGYRVNTTNSLRLWQAQAVESFDFQEFNVGDYYHAVEKKMFSETITKILYPNDEPLIGKRLRLAQQYFFVSCSLQDMISLLHQVGKKLDEFHESYAAQLNDTHPSIAVAELMRLLIDEHGMDWTRAWEITRKTFAYTNHTLLPEALEKWPVDLFASVLPRHLEIIYEINRRFLDEVQEIYPQDVDKRARLSLIDESGERYVRMAHLACVGSHAVNGVAALHTELLKEDVLRDFYELMPEKFSNKTNGVTPRRFLVLSNPRLTNLIRDAIGEDWIKQLDQLRRLESYANDSGFQEEWQKVKRDNKEALADLIRKRTDVTVDPDSMFDIQVKRIHEYKRQHLNVLHILTLYNRIRNNPNLDITPRTFIFGGKAAPGYYMAKLMIRLINGIGEIINNDLVVKDRLKVVFFPNFNVKNGHYIYPAADLSEQISTAGKEASGTGNMKFSLNGALTIGTYDGANIEIRDEVGAENFFLFGLTTEEVQETKVHGYSPRHYYECNSQLCEIIDLISSGLFSRNDADLFKPLIDSLLYHDDYMLFADYQSYIDCQQQVGETYGDNARWAQMSILNTARMGKFSSDRAIREYCEDIWKTKSQPVKFLE